MMDRGYDYRRFAVLVVDDEEKTLKYFDKAYSKEFQILTASSAEQAWELLEQQGAEVGVLVTDQRMPGQTGVDLLTKVRQKYPDIVRIITTAYADLEDAIEAVNSGEVFRYITKPWDIRDLRATLKRGMEFFLVQRERDTLLREKLSVLQRMIILDRVRGFAVLAASLTCRIRNSMTALKAFFDLAPVCVDEQVADATVNWGDLWTLAQQESQRLVTAVDEVLHTTVGRDYSFSTSLDLAVLVHRKAQEVQPALAQRGVSVHLDVADSLAPLKGDSGMIGRLLEILLLRLSRLTNDEGHVITLKATEEPSICGTPGVRLTLTSDAMSWNPQQVASLFAALRAADPNTSELGMDVLSAFFIAHHHGGYLLVQPTTPHGPGFEVLLPFDPESAAGPPLEVDWLDGIFTNLEVWGLEGEPV